MRLLSLGAGMVVLAAAAAPSNLIAQPSGQAIFEQKCVACHSAGSERLIGPGLAGVTTRRDRAWVKRFIMEPDVMLNAGDPTAAELFQEFQGIVMPNLGVTDAEAEALIEYLDGGEAAAGGTAVQPNVVEAATEEQILLGQELFQGITRFTNGGPTCNACHEVTNDAVIGGGVLAAELTTVFSRLGGPGVRAILGSPPFPVMQRAYVDKPLTEEEVVALVGFLQRADEEQALHQPRDYGIGLFAAGVVGAVILLGLYSLFWGGRLKGSVNQSIYDRQIKST
jgi:cytochrome c2